MFMYSAIQKLLYFKLQNATLLPHRLGFTNFLSVSVILNVKIAKNGKRLVYKKQPPFFLYAVLF